MDIFVEFAAAVRALHLSVAEQIQLGQKLVVEQFDAVRRIIAPVVAVGKVEGVDVPLVGGGAFVDDLIAQIVRRADLRAAAFAQVVVRIAPPGAKQHPLGGGLALVAAIGETIPIVGPVIGGVTAVAVAITVSPKLALMVGSYFLVLHQLEANILVPKIMERRVGVSPVAVMVALLIGGALWGIIGAILAIPTAAILSVVIEEIVADHEVRIQRVR